MLKTYRMLAAFVFAASLTGCANPRKGPESVQHLGAIVPTGHCQDCAWVTDTIYFNVNSARLTSDARATLAGHVKWLNRYPNSKVIIAGHCDGRGSEAYNLALGLRRANADRAFLVANGIASDRIMVISYGKNRLIEAGDNAEARAKNRNAVTSTRQ